MKIGSTVTVDYHPDDPTDVGAWTGLWLPILQIVFVTMKIHFATFLHPALVTNVNGNSISVAHENMYLLIVKTL